MPDKPAIIMAESGEVVTYRELDERSNRGAQLFRSLGLRPGDVIALFMDNDARFLEIVWAAQRSGVLVTCLSAKLSVNEADYIVKDSAARLLIASRSLTETAHAVAALNGGLTCYIVEPTRSAKTGWDAVLAAQSSTPIEDQSAGGDMLYSSGTTGAPKGIKNTPASTDITQPDPLTVLAQFVFKFDQSTRYLSPAPLYHTAPLRWTMAVHRLGGTVVILEKFDAEAALLAIERHRIDRSQWVPTHFVRLLRLPQETRARYDVSSLKMAIHAAAPCPVPIKEQMLEWWGPVLFEYYAGTESNGVTMITPSEWLQKKGSVGRALVGKVKICGEDGEPVPARTEGGVFFADGKTFEYHNAPDKTAASRNQHGWSTLGDIGYLDEDDYLFLTDRKAFTIISGGVNIYPQEIENLLVTHPKVLDAAVVGAPDEDMGEKVVAVIQPVDWREAGPGLEQALRDFARAHLSHVKVPRIIAFQQELPRHPNGKLYKQKLKAAYWPARS